MQCPKMQVECKMHTEKKILPLQSKISIVALEKIVLCHSYKFQFSCFLCKRVEECSIRIQDRFPRLQLVDLFIKHLQINVSTRLEDSFSNYNFRLELNSKNIQLQKLQFLTIQTICSIIYLFITEKISYQKCSVILSIQFS